MPKQQERNKEVFEDIISESLKANKDLLKELFKLQLDEIKNEEFDIKVLA